MNIDNKEPIWAAAWAGCDQASSQTSVRVLRDGVRCQAPWHRHSDGAVMTLCHVSRTDVTPIRHTSHQYHTQHWTMNPGTSINNWGSVLIDHNWGNDIGELINKYFQKYQIIISFLKMVWKRACNFCVRKVEIFYW